MENSLAAANNRVVADVLVLGRARIRPGIVAGLHANPNAAHHVAGNVGVKIVIKNHTYTSAIRRITNIRQFVVLDVIICRSQTAIPIVVKSKSCITCILDDVIRERNSSYSLIRSNCIIGMHGNPANNFAIAIGKGAVRPIKRKSLDDHPIRIKIHEVEINIGTIGKWRCDHSLLHTRACIGIYVCVWPHQGQGLLDIQPNRVVIQPFRVRAGGHIHSPVRRHTVNTTLNCRKRIAADVVVGTTATIRELHHRARRQTRVVVVHIGDHRCRSGINNRQDHDVIRRVAAVVGHRQGHVRHAQADIGVGRRILADMNGAAIIRIPNFNRQVGHGHAAIPAHIQGPIHRPYGHHGRLRVVDGDDLISVRRLATTIGHRIGAGNNPVIGSGRSYHIGERNRGRGCRHRATLENKPGQIRRGHRHAGETFVSLVRRVLHDDATGLVGEHIATKQGRKVISHHRAKTILLSLHRRTAAGVEVFNGPRLGVIKTIARKVVAARAGAGARINCGTGAGFDAGFQIAGQIVALNQGRSGRTGNPNPNPVRPVR